MKKVSPLFDYALRKTFRLDFVFPFFLSRGGLITYKKIARRRVKNGYTLSAFFEEEKCKIFL